jgi:tetratricopeptide (TPR) repeat protein
MLHGTAVDLKQIGRELNVCYVLEGSVQRGGARMRVNVQLIDAETGNHLWAERFDRPLADLFDMQDEIVARLAGTLNGELIAAEAQRAEKAANPNSMDLYFQGLAWFHKGLTPDNIARARSFFDRALIADPDNVEALIASARTDQVEGVFFVTDRATAFATAEARLIKALSSVPDHARGHMQLGFVDIYTERAAQGIAECEHALALDRNLAQAHSYIGLGKILLVGLRKPNRTLLTPCSSAHAIRLPTSGRASRAQRSGTSAFGRKQSRGVGGRSKPTEIFRNRISSWVPRLQCLAELTRRVPRSGQGSPSPAPAPTLSQRAVIRNIWPERNAFSKASARPAFRNNDRSPSPRSSRPTSWATSA